MGSRKAKPVLPPLVVVIREGVQAAPSQVMAWRRLWSLLTAPENKTPGQTPQPARGEGDEDGTSCHPE